MGQAQLNPAPLLMPPLRTTLRRRLDRDGRVPPRGQTVPSPLPSSGLPSSTARRPASPSPPCEQHLLPYLYRVPLGLTRSTVRTTPPRGLAPPSTRSRHRPLFPSAMDGFSIVRHRAPSSSGRSPSASSPPREFIARDWRLGAQVPSSTGAPHRCSIPRKCYL